jgi:hypothetical protein
VFCKRAYPGVVCGEIWIFQGESTVFTCGPHMMRTTAKPPDRTPIPVPWSAPEFTACLFPPLSRPQRGPRCTLGSPRLLHLRLWGLLRQRDVAHLYRRHRGHASFALTKRAQDAMFSGRMLRFYRRWRSSPPSREAHRQVEWSSIGPRGKKFNATSGLNMHSRRVVVSDEILPGCRVGLLRAGLAYRSSPAPLAGRSSIASA